MIPHLHTLYNLVKMYNKKPIVNEISYFAEDWNNGKYIK